LTLPTKTVGSLGPVKTDVRAYLRPDSELPAVELEAIKDAIIANATAIDGLPEVTVYSAQTVGSNPAQIYIDAGGIDAQYEILISARRSDGGAPGRTGLFSYRAVRSVEVEEIASIGMHADYGSGVTAEAWSITIGDGGSFKLQVLVTGAVGSTVEWRAVVRRWVTG